MKTWHWLALGAGGLLLYSRYRSANANVNVSGDVIGPNNAAPTAESANYVVPSAVAPNVPLNTKPDVQVIPPKADGSVAFVIPGRVNPSFSGYQGQYANGVPGTLK